MFFKGLELSQRYAGERMCVALCHAGRLAPFLIGHQCSLHSTGPTTRWLRPRVLHEGVHETGFEWPI